MRRVIVESPFAAPDSVGAERNLTYARAALKDCINRGEAPLAAHLLYPQVLEDGSLHERELGFVLGFSWMVVAHAVVVYRDLGVSPGMQRGIREAERLGCPVEYREFGRWDKQESKCG